MVRHGWAGVSAGGAMAVNTLLLMAWLLPLGLALLGPIRWGRWLLVIAPLAALAAGNFGAVSAMAKIIGENEFSLLFHKGTKENIHFNKITTEFLLITIFGNDISLGFLRLKVTESVEQLSVILEPLLSM